MYKLLFSLLLIVTLGGPVFAQEMNIELIEESDFWSQDVDTTTIWGKWLVETVKPYWDELSEGMENYILPTTEIDITGLSPEEIIKQVNLGYVDYYKAIQEITPPPELKKYHEIIVEVYAVTSNMIAFHPEKNELLNKLSSEANQELSRVFSRHGVPQNIIDVFISIENP